MRIFTLFILLINLAACSSKPTQLKTGAWRGVVEM